MKSRDGRLTRATVYGLRRAPLSPENPAMASLNPPYAGSRLPHSNSDRLDPNAAGEIHYWAGQWGVSPDQLLQAMAEVGTNLRVVRQHCARAPRTLKA